MLEDLHWSDDATLSLLDELLPAAEQDQIAFLLVHRSDPDHPAWHLVDRARRRFRGLFFELELEPLPDVDARALAEADAGGELPEELALLLAERTGGNPYFVGEAIRDLRERGALERENGRLALVGEASIPAAIQEALQARLDRLDADARELLTTAAVIGRSFGLPLLERLLPRRALLPTLSELQWLQLVVEERSGAAPEYRFRHGLVQEAAYGTLVEARRRELHLRVGEALVELHRDSPAEVYGLLAHHFAEADEPERAVEYLLKAGDAARAVYAERGGDRAVPARARLHGADRGRGPCPLDAAQDRAHPPPRVRLPRCERGVQPRHSCGLRPRRQARAERSHLGVDGGLGQSVAPGYSSAMPALEITVNLFRGLVAIGRDFDIEPDLAERFTVSDDGRSYRFTLRPDAAGATARPSLQTISRSPSPGWPRTTWSPPRCSTVVRANALDEHTLELRLREPRNDFLYLLAPAAALRLAAARLRAGGT